MQQQCGVCSALSSLFRRIMCIPPSRRGSQESSQQRNENHDSISGGAAESVASSAVLLPMPGESMVERRRGSGSEGACPVIVARPRGRFLTMHKRRRKRLTTRSLHDTPALLDDIHHGLVQCILERVWQWPFNAFILDTVTGGRSLPVLCVHLFHWYGLMDHFNLDVVLIWKFFSIVEEGYHSTNPYHNAIHATDVTQAMHCFLQEEKIREHLTPLEIMCALIAAVTHDLDHPGVNQPFLIATSNHLAALYQNTSVLENHHWRSAMGCLLESHLGDQLAEYRPELERQISSLILATDITRQQEFLTRFKKYLDEDSLDMKRPEDRHFILQIALKCADISNPCRPWDVSRKWSMKVCEEFFRQGDYERQLNLPVTSLCDRQTTSIPKIQAGFFRFVVAPLFEEWHRFLDTGLSSSMMGFLRGNHAKWEAMIQEELAEETRTEISEAEELEEVGTDTEAPVVVGRRHSVPSNRLPRHDLMHRRYTLVPPTTPILLFEEDEETSCMSEGSEERPVSSESLLPDVSIATMAPESRLASVLHSLAPPAPPHRLTRQQTFPPVQPYIRSRYMSTTAEMNTSLSSSSSSTSSENHSNRPMKSKCKEKENVDPSDMSKQLRKSFIQVQVGLSRRRGSAPVVSALVSNMLNGCSTSSGPGCGGPRRGSVPTDPTCQSVLRPVAAGYKENSGCSPVPPPLPPSLRTAQGSDVEERVRKCRRKKLLARRSSGGPETFLPPPKSPTPSWRRASLPLDVLAPSFLCRSSSMKETMRH